MLEEHTLGKQFQTRPNAEHFLPLFAAHGLLRLHGPRYLFALFSMTFENPGKGGAG